jgi:CHASE2 domain-containing sensor protein
MVAIAALGVLAAYLVWHTSTGNDLELATMDARFQLRGQQQPWPGVMIVGIDPASVAAYGTFPFDRKIDAALIDRLRRDGVHTIAFDLVFDHASVDPAGDLALLQAADRARGRLVLAANATDSHGQTAVLGGIANQRAGGFRVGSALFSPSSDGDVRRVSRSVEGLQSFAVASVLSAGVSPTRLPALFDGGSQWIDFPGPAIAVPTVSMVDVLRGRVPPARLRGRIVVIGATDTDLQDFHTVGGWPSAPLSGPEIEADSIATLMRGAPLRSVGTALNWLVIVLAALIVPLLAWRRTRWPRLVAAALLSAAALLVSSQIAFDGGTIILLFAPLSALLVATIGAVLVPLAIERRELAELRDRFARFDPAVVDAVLADPGIALRARALAIGPESVIAGHRLISLIGRGGMGVVYESVQLTLDRPVALKLINPARADDEEFRTRFVRESRVAAGLEHPHVIPVYEARDDSGLLFIAMRLVRGPSLADVLASEAPLAPAHAARLVSQIAAALGAAHARGLVHRDVKPANILLHERDHAYLTDFGVTRELGSESGLTAVGERIGTVDYMSPEQCRGERVGPAADIYSLGCVLFEALTGRVPYIADSEAERMAAHLHDPIPRASEVWPAVPAALDAVIIQTLDKDPGRRFVTAALFAAALERAAGIAEVAPVPREPPPLAPAGGGSDAPTLTGG